MVLGLTRLKKDYLYYAALFLMMFYDVVLRQSNLKKVYDVTMVGNIVWAMVIVLLLFKMILTSYTLREMGIMFVIAFICICSWRASGEITLLKFLFFTLAIKGINIEKVERIFIITSISLMLVVILSSLIGIIPNEIVTRRYGLNRYNLGFVAPSTIGYYVFSLGYLYLARCFKKIRLRVLVWGSMIMGFLWYVVNCKTAILALMAVYLLFLVAWRWEGIFLTPLTVLAPSLFGIITVYFMVFFNNKNMLHNFLNNLMSRRFMLTNIYYRRTGIHLFGFSTDNEALSGIYLDNAYAALLLRWGIVSFLMLILIYSVALYKMVKRKNIIIIIGILGAALYSLSEAVLYSYGTNLILFYVANELFNSRSESVRRRKECGSA